MGEPGRLAFSYLYQKNMLKRGSSSSAPGRWRRWRWRRWRWRRWWRQWCNYNGSLVWRCLLFAACGVDFCLFLLFCSCVFLGFTRCCLIFWGCIFKRPFGVCLYYKFLFGRSKVRVFTYMFLRLLHVMLFLVMFLVALVDWISKVSCLGLKQRQ